MDFGFQVCRRGPVIPLPMRDPRPHQIITYQSILNKESVILTEVGGAGWRMRAEGALIFQTMYIYPTQIAFRRAGLKCDSVSNIRMVH